MSSEAKAGDPRTTEPRAGIRALQGLVAAALIGFVAMMAGVDTPVPFAGWYVVSSLVPAAAIVIYRPGRWILPVSLAVVAVPLVLLTANRLDADRDGFDRAHDGGVVATRAAAEMVTDGVNPYTADFTDPLRPDHHRLAEGTRSEQANPLVDHYPYLPAAFLVQVPVVAAADLVGVEGDPRLLYAVCFAAVVVLFVRIDRPPWARGAALWALGANAAVAVYLPWGANDAAAAALLVLGAFSLRRRPVLGGVLVAMAVSLKALLVVALLPLAVVALTMRAASSRPSSSVLARSAAAFVATLVVTCAPYFIASPGDFVEDTVKFNLGATDLTYPVSGIGLAATYPDLVTDGVMLVLSAALLGVVGLLGVRWLRRRPTVPVALVVAGALVLAGLIPARTFQVSYLPLPAVLFAAIWLDAGRTRHGSSSEEDGRASQPGGAASAVPSGNL